MKYSNIIILVAFLGFFTSCSSETEALIDFSGQYEGKLDCEGDLKDSYGESITIVITKSAGENGYLVDFGDDVVFEASQSDNVLEINPQTINEDQDFDQVFMDGEITLTNNEFMLDFMSRTDDEPESTCTFPIVKL